MRPPHYAFGLGFGVYGLAVAVIQGDTILAWLAVASTIVLASMGWYKTWRETRREQDQLDAEVRASDFKAQAQALRLELTEARAWAERLQHLYGDLLESVGRRRDDQPDPPPCLTPDPDAHESPPVG